MMPERDRDVVREGDGDRDGNGNVLSRASGGEKEEISRGSWDRDRDGGRNRGRGRGKEGGNSKDFDSDRRVGSRSFGGETEQARQFSGDRSRRYNDSDAADLRKREVYDDDERQTMGRDRDRDCDDEERRPMGRGRGRGRGWGGRGRGDIDKPIAPPLYSVLKAKVQSIRPFGIFVQMEGYRNPGLVHLSQVSDHEVTNRDDSEEEKVKALSSVVNEGEQVWTKVISVKVEDNGNTKVGCSMKYVSQGDGQDLDPNNIHAEKHLSRPSWKETQKFKLEAVYNVQCERCGGHGHLKKECYSSGEKAYKLLSDDEDAEVTVQNHTNSAERLPTENSKHMQPRKPVTGISNHLLATCLPLGRGRAVVQPAWMKHGIGVGGPAPPVADAEQKPKSALPAKMESVEDALAVIAMLKEEKQKRKDERHKKKDKRHRSKDEKKDKHKKRHRNEDDHKERHASRKKHRDVETSDEDDHKERHASRKKHRDVETSDVDDHKERKKHRDGKDKERKKRRDVESSDEDDDKEPKKHRDEKDSKERKKRRDVERR